MHAERHEKHDVVKSIRRKFANRMLDIELTDACNLRCPLCSTGASYNKWKKKGLMDFDKFTKLLDQMEPVIDGVTFVGSGEVFLHERFFDFVAYATSKGLWTECPSNGTLITDPEAVVRSGLKRINIAIDGATQEQYEKYRVKGKLEDIFDGVRGLVEAKRKLKSYYPEIFIVTIVSRHNEMSLPEIEKLARELGADGQHHRTIMDELDNHSLEWAPVTEPYRPIEREVEAKCYFQDKLGGNVTWNGEWNICCFSPHYKDVPRLPNAFESEDILADLDSDEFLETMRKAGKYDMCEGCFYVKYESYYRYMPFNGLKLKAARLLRSPDPMKLVARSLSRRLRAVRAPAT